MTENCLGCGVELRKKGIDYCWACKLLNTKELINKKLFLKKRYEQDSKKIGQEYKKLLRNL